MTKNKLIKIEETYLLIFKIVLLFILTVALIISFLLLTYGVIGLFQQSKTPEPAKQVSPFNIQSDDFINKIESDNKEKKDKESSIIPDSSIYNKNEVFIDKTDQIIDDYIDTIWNIFDKYQNNCKIQEKIEKDDFLKNFPKSSLKDTYNQFGFQYIISLETFLKDLLSDERIVNHCIKNEGKGQVFMKSIGFHRQKYSNWINETDEFVVSEKNRVENFISNEKIRISKVKKLSRECFLYSLIAFGVFMSITLLLIISKVEYNLRQLKTNN